MFFRMQSNGGLSPCYVLCVCQSRSAVRPSGTAARGFPRSSHYAAFNNCCRRVSSAEGLTIHRARHTRQ